MKSLYLDVCRSGRHWEGAAAFALENFGAIFGQGDGIQGKSYAIATAGVRLADIKVAVERFTQYAIEHPEQNFLVTRIGCGLGGGGFRKLPLCFVTLHC